MRLWTDEEKARYVPRNYKPLNYLYEKAETPTNESERRAQYLAETVLKLRMIEHD